MMTGSSTESAEARVGEKMVGSFGEAREPSRTALVEQDTASVFDFFTALARHWRVVVGFPVVLAVVVAAYSLIVAPTFTAGVAFAPERRSTPMLPAGLAGLAGQMGFSLDENASQSPRFYAEVVRSRALMHRILLAWYPDTRAGHLPGDSVRLIDVVGPREGTLPKRLQKAMRRFQEQMVVRVDPQTNIVRISIDSRYPALAAAVANRFIVFLNEFNAQSRQSQARTRRLFVEGRLADGERELRAVEEELKGFFERNRSWEQSPQLRFEEGRLRRQVEIRQEVYLTLQREYETARIQEVNDAPVITIIDPAVEPQERSKPKRRLLVMLAFIIGGTVGILWALGGDYLYRLSQREPGKAAELRAFLQRARVGFRGRRASRARQRAPGA